MKRLYTLLLTLSLATVTANASIPTGKHIIKKGETLSAIARKHHTTVAEVRKINGLKKGDVIQYGKVLRIPTNTYVSNTGIDTKPIKYVIKKGDTLSAIAKKHHTSVTKVRKANGLRKNEALKIGKILKVPQSKKRIAFAKVNKKASNKRIVTALSGLDTISLNKNKVKKSNTFRFSDIFVSSDKKDTDKCVRITSAAKEKLGKRYVWGASGNGNTYDCSSFVKYVYKKNGIDLPRTSINQSKFGKYIERSQLKKGDLIFFDTSKKRKGYVNHVGIYLGDNKFIHASSAKKKVVITSLNKPFYSQRFKVARRVTTPSLASL
ncbi:MAG: NlpC/P60 family protein [Sulfurovum sp.]|nr:NlpC/P60 family protein [Sulfurovum sp.]